MKIRFRNVGIPMLVVLAGLVFAGATHAQTTTTTETKSFEILSVDGNVLVIREPQGTREVTVPSDFRFTVDGKSLAVTDLKPGMKGTAKVTKTTIFHPVYVTEVKNVTVVKTMGGSVILQGVNGYQMFSQSELDKQGVQVFMDGKPVKLEDLREGDKLSASIVTEGPPQKLSKTEVDVTLAKAAAAGSSVTKVTTTSTTSEPAPAVVTPAADTVATPAADTIASPLADSTAVPAAQTPTFLWLGILFIILVIILLVRRRSKR